MKANLKQPALMPLEKDTGQVQDIYKMINQQEKYMEDLLSKYNIKSQRNDLQKDEEYSVEVKSRTLDPSYTEMGSRSIISRGVSSDRANFIPMGISNVKRTSLDLPSISPRKHKKNIKQLKSKTPNPHNPYFFDLKPQPQKDKMKQVLQRAYLQDRSLKPSKVQLKPHIKNTIPVTSEEFSHLMKMQKESRMADGLKSRSKEEKLPEPMGLGYFNNFQKESNSSEQGQVPLTYYEGEYRGLVRGQLLQQTNFLYFSKDQSMQGWTEGLLMLFQKHDKELASLRKRCKYLQKFDSNFFSVDIFCND